MPRSCSINWTKTKLAASSTLRNNESLKSVIEQLTLGNHAATELWEEWLAPLPGSWVSQSLRELRCRFLNLRAWKLSFSVFPRVALPFPQFALLRSVICVQTQADNNSRKLRLLCGCQFPWCALAHTLLFLATGRNSGRFDVYCCNSLQTFGVIISRTCRAMRNWKKNAIRYERLTINYHRKFKNVCVYAFINTETWKKINSFVWEICIILRLY
jgi:hypothetical protein